MSLLTLEAKLERQEPSTPWGFRMQGGKDFSSPLTIARVNPGSLAAKCGLQQGDIILKIGSKSSDTLKHKDAQDAILSYGNKLDLLLQRGGAPTYEKFSTPFITAHQGYPSNQNYNQSAKPFGANPPGKPQYGPKAVNPGDIHHQTQNLSLNNPPPDFSKYANVEDKPARQSHQSKSFRFLSDTLESGQEPPSKLKPLVDLNRRSPSPTPVPAVAATGGRKYNSPAGLYSASNLQTAVTTETETKGTNGTTLEPQEKEYDSEGRKLYRPSETFRLIQQQEHAAEPPEKTVPEQHSLTFKALEKQLGNSVSRTGISSVSAHHHRQLSDDRPFDLPDSIIIPPSETLRLVHQKNIKPEPHVPEHSPSFKELERQLGPSSSPPKSAPVAKPGVWTPSGGSQSGSAPTVKPYAPPTQPMSQRTAPPKPSGVGAIRGKVGDAVMKPGDAPGTGRVPVCNSCGTTIRGPFVTAIGKSWCPDHFVCANPRCGVKLLDIGFIEEGGFLYCEKDYELHFAPHCAKCDAAVVGECVNALNKQYHPRCFLCFKCKQPIGGGQFHLEDGNQYCEDDWRQMFQTMCSACNFPVEPGDKWVEALNSNFHSECFNCSTCQVNLEGQAFYAKANKPYCKKHAK